MMGRQPPCQPKLFYQDVSLEKRVPGNHILRKAKESVDFDFTYNEVKDTYGVNGNVSVPPPVILKIMLILFLFNVRSERELMSTIPLRLDWLWFLGYDLDSEVPNHSVLSKARSRWGVEVFKGFFKRIVSQCVQAGLVDGDKLFVDSSLIDADASNNSVIDMHSLKKYLNKSYRRLEERLDDLEDQKTTPADSRYISTTDPDASVTRRKGVRSKLRYKTHRGIDSKHEVITATKVTAGSRDDGELLEQMIEEHQHNTNNTVDTVVADSKYGTIDNFLLCHDLEIKAHVPFLEQTHRGTGRQKGIIPKEAFSYNPETDTFRCPAGQVLKRRHYYKKRKHFEYKASSEICKQCEIKIKCTNAKDGRTLKRHARQDELEAMVKHSNSRAAKRDLKTRKHLSERSFAQAKRYGYKRARWRRLWRMQIQDYLLAAVQNIKILVNNSKDRAQSNANALVEQINSVIEGQIYFLRLIFDFENVTTNFRKFFSAFAKM